MTRRRRPPTDDDVTAMRHNLWRAHHAGGWSMDLIAAVYGVSKSTVHRAIDRDRQVREALEDAAIP